MDCLVTQDDFYEAMNDVRGSMGTHDHTEDEPESSTIDDTLNEKQIFPLNTKTNTNAQIQLVKALKFNEAMMIHFYVSIKTIHHFDGYIVF